MGKQRIAPKSPPAAQAIPLEALTITWRRRQRYYGEPEDGVDLTITGAQLAAVLGTLAEEDPHGDWDSLGDSRTSRRFSTRCAR